MFEGLDGFLDMKYQICWYLLKKVLRPTSPVKILQLIQDNTADLVCKELTIFQLGCCLQLWTWFYIHVFIWHTWTWKFHTHSVMRYTSCIN